MIENVNISKTRTLASGGGPVHARVPIHAHP